MADTKINRSFIPPTETEKVDSEVYPIVWSLGTTDHPWKNLFISDYETKEGETLKVIDVYSTLKYVDDIPKTGKEYGNVLTVDQNNSTLKWITIDEVVSTHATANALVYKISSTPVQRAEADEDGLNIKNNYLKLSSFTANNIKSTLGNVAVKRAIADSSGNKFEDTYVNREYVDNNYIHRTGSSTSSALTDQCLGAVCFTNSYNDLDDKPYIPDSEWVKTEINARINTHVQQKHVSLESRLTADETQITNNKNNIATNAANITTNATNIATNTSNITAANNRITSLSADTIHLYDYATTSKAGIVKISTENGLNIGSNGLLNVDKATSSKVGVVKVNGGNGLGYNASNGSVYMDKATTSNLGTVKIGSNITVSSDGTISLNTASTSNLGLVKVGSNINVSSGTISVNTSDTSKLGLVKVGSNITVSSGTISLTGSNVINAIGYTPLKASDYLGSPTSSTPATTDNSTRVATTAFVQSFVKSLQGNTQPKTVKSILNKTKMAEVSSSEIYDRGTSNDWRYGYGQGDIYLSESYENYDKVAIITGNDGSQTHYTIMDVWFLKMLFNKGTYFSLIKYAYSYWLVDSYLYGSTATYWKTQTQNSSIVDIIGIKY